MSLTSSCPPIMVPMAVTLAFSLSSFVPILVAEEPAAVVRSAETSKIESIKKNQEKMQVTGSRIKRTDIESAAPTVVISREQIESSGASTVAELLRKQASSSTGNFDGNVGFVRGGSSTANLFGLGSGRTLVLLDGERLPKDASIGGTNLSLIPPSMIERVEILSGSRSAIYGSDAVAGVINVITRKNFTGSEVKTSVRAPQLGGGERLELSASTGFQKGPLGVVLAVSGAKENRVLRVNRDLDFGEGKYGNSTVYAPEGTYSWRLVDPVSFKPIGEKLWQASSNCPAENRSDLNAPEAAASPNGGVYCVGSSKANSPAELLPAYDKRNISAKLDLELGSSSKITGFAAYSQSESKANQGPTFFQAQNAITNRYLLVDASIASQLIPEIKAGEAAEIRQRLYGAPVRASNNLDRGYGGFLAFDSELAADTNLNISLNSFVSTNTRTRSHVINRDRYDSLFFPANRLPNYTGYGLAPSRDPVLLSSVTDDLTALEINKANGITANLSKSFLKLPGGELTASFGIDFRRETFDQTPDPLDTGFWPKQKSLPLYTGTEGIAGNGKREVASLFAELNAPVMTNLQLEAAVRQDKYSDFGSAGTYNVGAKITTIPSLTLRSSAGTSFRAPELNYLHQVGGGGYETITDQNRCAYLNSIGTKCDSPEFSIFVDRPGNPGMKAETSKSYTIGAIYEPNEHVYLSADYGAFAIANVFNRRSAEDVAKDYFANKGTGAAKVILSGDDQGNYINSAAVPWENIGQELNYLVLAEGAFSTKVDAIGLAYKTSGTRTISHKTEEVDGTLPEQNGTEGYPAWRWNNTISSTYETLTWNISTQTIARQVPSPKNAESYKPYYYNDTVPEYTQHDSSLDWAFMKSSKATLGVINIANKIGGAYRTGNYTGSESSSGSLYSSSWYGRTYFANLTQTF